LLVDCMLSTRPLIGQGHEYWWTHMLLRFFTPCEPHQRSPIRYHIHAVLIQDTDEPLSQFNVSLYHTLREGNQCADFFAKLEAPQISISWLCFSSRRHSWSS
jgi:hypothetical protein